MPIQKTLAFIGGGNMAEALIKGLTASGAALPSRVIVSDILADKMAHLANSYGITAQHDKYEAAKKADIIVIAVKPKDVKEAVSEIAPALNNHHDKLLISVAAGVTTGSILAAMMENGLHRPVPIVRAMPNTPATISEGITAIYAGDGVSVSNTEMARAVFGAVGKTILVRDEALMDAVTGLSGSGPAYFFLIFEALAQAGVDAGLDKDDARLLSLQTALGAAKLALESDKSLEDLRKMVTSPGGTTIEGLKALEAGDIRGLMGKAVKAAVKRSKELSI